MSSPWRRFSQLSVKCGPYGRSKASVPVTRRVNCSQPTHGPAAAGGLRMRRPVAASPPVLGTMALRDTPRRVQMCAHAHNLTRQVRAYARGLGCPHVAQVRALFSLMCASSFRAGVSNTGGDVRHVFGGLLLCSAEQLSHKDLRVLFQPPLLEGGSCFWRAFLWGSFFVGLREGVV